ncbi:tetratricopeptide repeat protein [Adhaeribacter sp. BT258]|uniref:Tetratricopeptide repeat protein n=1 Tax=Adhaeribacter terrigena TaxID=2793070 RepID=A0ABS1BY51_9BACT|nr:tetratricopeptide repeat protein [Adhaeribacter terrigena]MBK0401978.1 tetratricopeptide repeat protein [Adhaeribacter terrigena]
MKLLLFLFAAVLFSLEISAQCDDLKPMYGLKCEKTAAMRKADDTFRNAAIKQFGSADSAAQVYLRRGWNNFRNLNQAAAMKNLNQAWLLNANDPEIYFAFGHLVRFAFTKNAPEAGKYYQLARDRDPKRTAEKVSYVRLIAALENGAEPQAVIDACSQLIQSFPEYKNGLGYKKRAQYYTQMQLPDRAVKDWTEALKFDPNDAGIYAGRGAAYFWLKDPEKALTDLEKALALKPGFAEAHATRAQVQAGLQNQPAAALTEIDKALAINDRKPEFYKLKSQILLLQNQKTEACKCLKNGIEKGLKSLAEDYKTQCGK